MGKPEPLSVLEVGPVTMDEAPSEEGSHLHKRSQPRVLQPDLQQESSDLKDECKEFVNKISQYQKIVEGLIEVKDEMTKEVETEKMKAIGARNLLKTVAKQREAQQQQLQTLIAEKKLQHERYRIEYEALRKVEPEQNEFIDQFVLQK
ncbi:intraflagellar transport protein 20 homolog isoform X1 [Takifugu flavidus]|nr:intraflagellar transport protein 20 homolog isoform X1 [Takifugu flavidus]|eukprot:XP_003977821.2 PREDICTED: intraflagellar transport protein 20 homolog isoform X1 [Takifugu rubripes]